MSNDQVKGHSPAFALLRNSSHPQSLPSYQSSCSSPSDWLHFLIFSLLHSYFCSSAHSLVLVLMVVVSSPSARRSKTGERLDPPQPQLFSFDLFSSFSHLPCVWGSSWQEAQDLHWYLPLLLFLHHQSRSFFGLWLDWVVSWCLCCLAFDQTQKQADQPCSTVSSEFRP